MKHVTRKQGDGEEGDDVKRGDLGRSREDPEIDVIRKERNEVEK